MLRVVAIALTAILAFGLGRTAGAEPPAPPPGPGWHVVDGRMAWTSPEPLFGDAAVEFWSGGRSLGRARSSADHRTFSLPGVALGEPEALEVRAAGRRLDRPEPRPAAVQGALPFLGQVAGVDPGVPGPYQTITGEYSLDSVRLPGLDGPIEMQGVVVAPKGARGDRPLVLFLHGRHIACFDPKDPQAYPQGWPCPSGALPVPSYRGYLQSQRLLASQGYVTVSISANAINALDDAVDDGGAQARSSLVRLHLARWAAWAAEGRGSAPQVVRDAPVVDMANVLLMGHSRGGEGVNAAALDSLVPPPFDSGYSGPVRWKVRGTVLVAPTAFGQNPTPDAPSVTLLPACDGDVSNLEGQQYIDATRGVSRGKALHSALYIAGANHNFFNLEWTPGESVAPSSDDFQSQGPEPDPLCSAGMPARLTAAQQRSVGATYTAAAAHLFQNGDLRVLPLLDGTGVRAPSADPARVLSHALGGARTPVFVPDATSKVSGSGKVCDQISVTNPCLTGGPANQSPHTVLFAPAPTEAGRSAVDMRWTASGAATAIELTRPVVVGDAQSLALRMIVPPGASESFTVAVTDTQGRRTSLGTVSLTGLPGFWMSYWGQEVRVPVPSAMAVAKLELVPLTESGQAWLLDAHGWRTGLPDPDPAPLTRVDLGALVVAEGDSGSRTHQIPVTITGAGGGAVKVFQGDRSGWNWTERAVTLTPGQRTFEVPVTVVGNTRWSTDYRVPALLKAAKGVVVGSFGGKIGVTNDDPVPTLSITPSVTVVEGSALTWRLTLSTEADSEVFAYGRFDAPAGPELSTTDVSPEWLERVGVDPLPSRPLSGTRAYVDMQIPPGSLSAELAIPTVVDGEVEAPEHVRAPIRVYPAELGKGFELTATVTDR